MRKIIIRTLAIGLVVFISYWSGPEINNSLGIFFKNSSQKYLDYFINSDADLNREVRTVIDFENTGNLFYLIRFYDKQDKNGDDILRTVEVNVFNEISLPIILAIAFTLLSPFSRRGLLKQVVLFNLIVWIYVFLKLLIFVYDNYNYPEFILIDLGSVRGGVVYWVNRFYNMTGNTTAIIFPIIIWAAINFKYLNLDALINNSEENKDA